MAKPIRRSASEANIVGASDASGVPHKMKLRRRQALGDISSAVGVNNTNIQRQQGGSNAGGRKTVSNFYHRLRVVVYELLAVRHGVDAERACIRY